MAKALSALEGALEPGSVVPLDQLKVIYSRAVVARYGGNKSHAAKALGVSRRSLYRLLEREAG